MPRLALVLALGIPTAFGIGLGCGGSDDSDVFAAADKDAATTSDSPSANNDSTTTSPDAGNLGDAAKAETSITLTSNPGKVTCGSTECGSGSVCCLKFSLDGGTQQSCESSCGVGSFKLTCDEKADCPNSGDKCCLELTGTLCDNNCPGPTSLEVVLCKTNAECGDGGVCNPKKCAGRTFDICGSPPACN